MENTKTRNTGPQGKTDRDELRQEFLVNLAVTFQAAGLELAQNDVNHLAYLAQELYALPLQYRFSQYLSGPQTDEVPSDLGAALSRAYIRTEHAQHPKTQTNIVPGSKASQYLEAQAPGCAQDTANLIRCFGHQGSKNLSLTTTLLFLHPKYELDLKRDESTVIQNINTLKPNVTRDEILRATRGLQQVMDRLQGRTGPPNEVPGPPDQVTVPVRFVARTGQDRDWAMYMHWAHLSDEEIAGSGDKVQEEQARAIIIATMGVEPKLRGFLSLKYRL